METKRCLAAVGSVLIFSAVRVKRRMKSPVQLIVGWYVGCWLQQNVTGTLARMRGRHPRMIITGA